MTEPRKPDDAAEERPLGLAGYLDEEAEWDRLMTRVHRSIARRELSGQAVELGAHGLTGVLLEYLRVIVDMLAESGANGVLTEHLLKAWQDLVATVTGVLPRLILGVVIAVVLVLTAKFIRRMTGVACRRAQVDRLSESLGLAALVSRLGVRQPASVWIPGLVYAGTLLLFAQTGATMLGLTPIADSIRAFFAYLPNVIAAIAVLLAGSAAAEFAGQAVRRAAEDSGIDLAPTLGSVSSALILFVTGIMALSQLKIDTEMIRIVTICALGGIALAFGLSLGLGSRDVTRNMIAGFYARKVLRPGDTVTVGERTGTLVMITPTQTVIALPANEELAVSNGVYLDSGSGVAFTAAGRSHQA